ncbi:hypothetical protein [Streptomyces sp. NPDC058382]|uniref:hypothetical protein n=1 Tax=unclassified Streptomyces TaxID=2593676 RepID=UPI0036434676
MPPWRNRVPLWSGRAPSYVLNGLVISVFMLSAACLLLGLRIPVDALPGLAAELLPAEVGAPPSASRWGARAALP